MKILHVIDSLDLRTGGPASGLRAVTPMLQAQGHYTTILTLDAPGAAASGLEGCTVIAVGPAHGSYRIAPGLLPWLTANLFAFDAVVVHGLWQSPGRTVRLAARKAGVPYFVYAHGMLDPWFRQAFPGKHLKKWLYWQVVERHVLRDAAAVLFTCEEERRLARRSFSPYACTERVVNHGTSGAPPGGARQKAAWYGRYPALRHQPFLLFLGRIHPKKGVDLLLQAWLALAARTSVMPALVIAGPTAHPELLQHLRAQAARTAAGRHVIWTGMLEGDLKWGALRAAEAFVLPSHQENFGIAVVEALAVGTPVLISQQVNIWREIVADHAGLADADTAAGTLALLAAWLRLPQERREAMRHAAAECYARRFNLEAVARSFTGVVQPFLTGAAARPPHR